MEFAIFMAQTDRQIATKFEFHYHAFLINSRQSKFAEYFLEQNHHFENSEGIRQLLLNITAKAALKFGSEVWVLKKREEQRLEVAQMKFLRHLLGITKLDKEKN